MRKNLKWFFIIFIFLGIKESRADVWVSSHNLSPEESAKILFQSYDAVIAGTVVGSSLAYYDHDMVFPSGRKAILTDWIVEVRQVFKGTITTQKILIQMPGGCIPADHLCYSTDLEPQLSEGDEAILFLRATGNKKWLLKDHYSKAVLSKNGLYQPIGLSSEIFMKILKGEK